MLCRLAVSAALVSIALLATVGCGGDATNMQTSVTPTSNNKIQCEATIMPGSFNYTVQGDTLTVTEPTLGQSQRLTRSAAGSGGRALYGTWLVGQQAVPNSPYAATLTTKMKFEPDRVTAIAECGSNKGSVAASASSRATITDTSVTILDTKSDLQFITY